MKLFLPFGKGLASFVVYVLFRHPLGAGLFTIRQSSAEPDVVVPIRRRMIQVQSKTSTAIRAIVPVRATYRSTDTHPGQPLLFVTVHLVSFRPAANHAAYFIQARGPNLIFLEIYILHLVGHTHERANYIQLCIQFLYGGFLLVFLLADDNQP